MYTFLIDETNYFAFTYFVSPIESYISELLFPILTLINFVNYYNFNSWGRKKVLAVEGHFKFVRERVGVACGWSL